MSLLHALLAVLSFIGVAASSTETLDYGLFRTLHLTRPTDDIAHTVLFFSDRDG